MEESKYINEQQEICNKYSLDFFSTSEELRIGISDNIKSGLMPINGLRHFPESNTTGWYIWAGEYSASPDFFKPMHLIHLKEYYPELLKYLGLPPGSRFLIDNKGYEDVWFDGNLLIYNEQKS